MKYDIERLEADYKRAFEEWQKATQEHYSPRDDLHARRARDNELMERAFDLGEAFKGVKFSFVGDDEYLDKMEAILKDYEVAE